MGELWRYTSVMWSLFLGLLALIFVVQTNGTLWTRFAVLAAIPLLLYNGQRGRKSKWYQWGYYLIYPIHFMVLYAIELLIR